MRKIFALGLIAFSLNSCGLDELIKKTNKMTEIVEATCNCDEARLLSYEDDTMGNVTAYFEIVGADVDKHTKIATEINEALKASVNNYCDIDDLTLDFVNKRKHNKITISNCKVK